MITHFLRWQRFQMACGKQPAEVEASASFWHLVDCKACHATRETTDIEPGDNHMTMTEDVNFAVWRRRLVLDHECTSAKLIDRFNWYFVRGVVLMPNRAEFRRYHRDDMVNLIAELDVTWAGRTL